MTDLFNVEKYFLLAPPYVLHDKSLLIGKLIITNIPIY